MSQPNELGSMLSGFPFGGDKPQVGTTETAAAAPKPETATAATASAVSPQAVGGAVRLSSPNSADTLEMTPPSSSESAPLGLTLAGKPRRKKTGRKPKQVYLTGVPDPFEMSIDIIGFRLENHRMDALKRWAEIYKEVEGKAFSPAHVARRFVCHMIKEMEHQLEQGRINLRDRSLRLP